MNQNSNITKFYFKKIVFSAFALFVLACSDNSVNKLEDPITPTSILESKDIAEIISEDKDIIAMMKEIESLGGETYETRGLKIKRNIQLDESKILAEVRKIKTKEELIKYYSSYMLNPEFLVEKLEKSLVFSQKVNSKYESQFGKMKLDNSSKQNIIRDAVINYQNVKSRNVRNNAADMGCIGTCNWVWRENEELCEIGLAVAIVSGGVGVVNPMVGAAGMLVGGTTYYICSAANEVNMIGCLENCPM